MLLRNMASPTSVAICKATHLCPTVLVVRGLKEFACESDLDSAVAISLCYGRWLLLGLERFRICSHPCGSLLMLIPQSYSDPTCSQ